MRRLVPLLFFIFFASLLVLGQESVPLLILKKSTPVLSEQQKKANFCVQGTVILRVVFLGNGQVGTVSPITSLPFGLIENAINAAKQIRFEPELRNGNPVAMTKVVTYNFYWGWTDSKADFNAANKSDEKAEAILKKAVQVMGGDKYLNVKTQIGRGRYSVIRDGAVVSFQSFIDVIVFPDKERTEFKGSGVKTVQVNSGGNGWTFDGNNQTIKDQGQAQIVDFKQGIRTSLDNLLRGGWRNQATLSYVGQRPSTLGKRNDVVKLTYNDGFSVEFEFADDGTPAKAIYKRQNADNEAITEEDHYAQFVDIGGIKVPYIIDRVSNGKPGSRINYDSVEFNSPVPDSVFAKPANAKDLKKDLKL